MYRGVAPLEHPSRLSGFFAVGVAFAIFASRTFRAPWPRPLSLSLGVLFAVLSLVGFAMSVLASLGMAYNRTNTNSPNHALQRTRSAVMPAAANPQTCRQPARLLRVSLSLESLGVLASLVSTMRYLAMREFGALSVFHGSCATLLASAALFPRGLSTPDRQSQFGLSACRAARDRQPFHFFLSAMRVLGSTFLALVIRSSPASASASRLSLHISRERNRTPNTALQRTRAAVTPAASSLRLSPTTQQSRPSRVSLSLGPLGVATRVP